MKSKPNYSAFPGATAAGLSKREFFTAMALMGSVDVTGLTKTKGKEKEIAELAVRIADETIAKLQSTEIEK